MQITTEIYEKYASELKSFILAKTKDISIAEDLLQEVFIKIHTKISTLQDHSKLKSWIFSIANHTVMDYFREAKNKNSLTKINNEPLEDIVESEHNHNEKDCLYGLISKLPKKYRDPLYLADIKGLKQAEIARQLNIPLATAKSQIQRARKMIAQGYIECCDYKLNEKGHLVGEIKSKEDCKLCG